MDRREFVRAGISAGALAGSARAVSAPAGGSPKSGSSGILDAGVWQQQELMQAGKLTSHSLTSQYLARIKTIARSGPRVNACIEINPEALKIALEMDRERGLKRVRGPLHGIPILLKDNIATGDRMSTSAGPLAQAGVPVAGDAFVAARLRAAGAVIIGKTNLSESDAMRSDHSVSGWSGRGGQTRHPYALERNCSGAGSGSGAAIAAGLATLAVGTETGGSIVSPASLCGLVGIKPTLGLVSRSGILPVANAQDTAGPMARSVADAALMLAAMAGSDPADPATAAAGAKPADYGAALDKGGLKGVRIGVARNFFGNNADLDEVIEQALIALTAQGAVLVDTQVSDVDQVMGEHSLDALVAPTGGRAWLTDFINGDHAGAGGSAPAAVTGHPHITVPAGQVHGLSVGLSFVGAAYSEAKLIGMAYAYEQATLHRRAPLFPASLSLAVR
ncbi:MAG: amidase family protein [Pseudomonadota bacterium]